MAKAKTPKFAVYCVDSKGPYFYGHASSKTALKGLVRDAKNFAVSTQEDYDSDAVTDVQVFELTPIL